MSGVVWVLALDFIIDALAEFASVFDGKINNDVKSDGLVGFIEIEAVHFEYAFVRKNNVTDGLLDFDDGFVLSVDGINTDSMEKNAIFGEDSLSEPTRDFVNIGDR